jgi:hypothetical protein
MDISLAILTSDLHGNRQARHERHEEKNNEKKTRNLKTKRLTAEPSTRAPMRRPVAPGREAQSLRAPVDDTALDVISVVGAGVIDIVSILVAVALGLADADAVVLVLADCLAARTPAVDGGVCHGREEGDEGDIELHSGKSLIFPVI